MPSRILFITHRVPYPPDRGDRIRTWNILRFLAARAEVDLACFADEPVSEETRNLLSSTVRRLAIIPHIGKMRYVRGLWSLLTGSSITEGMFRSPELGRQLREWKDTAYDATLVSSSGIADYTARPFVTGDPLRWVDLIDVDSRKWADYATSRPWPMSWVYAMESQRLRRTEQRLASECERLLVVSEAECDVFRSFCKTPRVHAVCNGVDTDYFESRFDGGGGTCTAEPAGGTVSQTSHNCPALPATGPVCVFVGVMNYLPNVDAVCWFADNVWTQIQTEFPDARFCIVG
ncbi:MAG: hypothetical protein KDA96_23595, partial [Planctomycetaceae bacterium]|nr:hypothetical protein [Planctomycetaceae bacterium]